MHFVGLVCKRDEKMYKVKVKVQQAEEAGGGL